MNDSAFVLQWEPTPRETLTRILVLEHFASLFGAVEFILGDRDLAHDATKDLFAAAVSLNDTQPFTGEVSPRVWLLALAVQLCLPKKDLERQPSGTPNSRKNQAADTLEAAIEALDAAPRFAVYLRYAEDLPIADIAHVLGWQPETAAQRLRKAEVLLAVKCAREPLPEGQDPALSPTFSKQIRETLVTHWPPPLFSTEELQEAIADIGSLVREQSQRDRNSRRAAENIRTTLLIAAIILVILLINPDTAVRTARTWLATPTAIPPTPILTAAGTISAEAAADALASAGLSLQILEHFPFPITTTGFSTDGELLAAGPGEYGIHACQAHSGLEFFLLEDFNPSVEEVALSPAKGLVATGTHNGAIILWQSGAGTAGKRLFVLPRHPGPITDLAFAPSGALLAVGTTDGTWLWEIGEKAERTAVWPGGTVAEIAFSPDGRWLVTYEGDQTIWFRSLPKTEVVLRLGGQEAVSRIAFSHDAGLVAVGAADHVQIWELSLREGGSSAARLVHVLNVRGGVQDLAFSPGRTRLAILTTFNEMFLWDASQAAALQPYLQIQEDQLSTVRFSADGGQIAIGTRQGDLYLLQRTSEPSPSVSSSNFFVPLGADQFTRDELANSGADCGRFRWQHALLSRQGAEVPQVEAPTSAIELTLPGSTAPVRLVGEAALSRSANTLIYAVYEDDRQTVLLNVHQPRPVSPWLTTAIEFEDTRVGQNANIETFLIDQMALQYLRGGWLFRITDEPIFEFLSVQSEEVDWQVRWEPELAQQRIRWENAGTLYDLIHFVNQGTAVPDGFLSKGDLIELIRILLAALESEGI